MTLQLEALCFDAHDPARLAAFWGGLLGWEPVVDPAGTVSLLPADDTGFRLRFDPSEEAKVVANQIHLDLTSNLEDQERIVARALDLGARHIDVGQRPDEGQVVLADPEGNELCVIEAGNSFLADCGFIGALSCDGSPEVGYFWSGALGWPLIWDQDQETAIRSPHGGPKVSWGGPPYAPRAPRNRVRFQLAPSPGGDPQAEVERLLALGAIRTDIGQVDDDAVAMADPDGNQFSVLTPR